MSQSASAVHAIQMGNPYWQLLMKKIIPQVLYHPGHAFCAHGIWKFQFWNFNFCENWIGYPSGEWLYMIDTVLYFGIFMVKGDRQI